MEQTPDPFTNGPRSHSYHAQCGEDMSYSPSRSTHHLTNDASHYATEDPASYYHETSLDWTQPPLAQTTSFADHVPGNDEYLDENFINTGDEMPVNSFNTNDDDLSRHTTAMTPEPGVLLPHTRRKSILKADGTTTKQRGASSQSRELVPSAIWETHKATIRMLYLEERKPLKDVIRIMHERHAFQATPKMYKTRFSQWGFAKNNTENEVKHLLSMKFERDAEGKVSEFIRNGKVVNLATYLKRKGVTEYDLVDFETTSRLPAHVRCRTPSPPPSLSPGYLRSPDLIRAQEILVGHMRKTLIHCQQIESRYPLKNGWSSLLLWGAESSGMLYQAGKLFGRSQDSQAGDLLMRAFQRLEVDLQHLSTQGTKELLFCLSHQNPGMTIALSKYLAAYSMTNFARLHPLRVIFSSLYEVLWKHGPAALSDLVWSAMPTLAEELETIHGQHSPLAVRTWIDLCILYNHSNPYRLSNLYADLGRLNQDDRSAVQEEFIGFSYARLQLAASIDVNGIAHRAQLVELWNYCVADNIVFGVHGQPEVYCWHPVLQVQPTVSRMLERYRVTMKHVEDIFGCKMICGYPLEPHPTIHADETDPPENYRFLKIPISLSDLRPMASPASSGKILEELQT
ncbi:Alpha-N-arabinofuranosidase 2 [Verticillium dahliae VDG2]|nr:Alpha-N-arabinofuranosidase 2 [Verticillium dahliae VDG2]